MALVQTIDGALHYDVVEQTAPWSTSGLPILFHHGIGSSGALWRGWYPALVDRLSAGRVRHARLRTLAHPGPDFAWSLDRMVDDLFAVADAAGLERFHLVGESIGGTIALAGDARAARTASRHSPSATARISAPPIGRVARLEEAARRGRSAGWSEGLHARPLPRRCADAGAAALVRDASRRSGRATRSSMRSAC